MLLSISIVQKKVDSSIQILGKYLPIMFGVSHLNRQSSSEHPLYFTSVVDMFPSTEGAKIIVDIFPRTDTLK